MPKPKPEPCPDYDFVLDFKQNEVYVKMPTFVNTIDVLSGQMTDYLSHEIVLGK